MRPTGQSNISPKPDLSAERREQILNAAEKVFTRLGFSKARIDDIVAESELSKGAIYWYYKSKDTIIAALLWFIDPEWVDWDNLADMLVKVLLGGFRRRES
ncbi:MAG: TetR/AcrR family transcriptional regulator [Anaerolineales bacterium]|nr:MAG: TetR/AcrR family transcriptional regulator [Anaerolineales bacterium]